MSEEFIIEDEEESTGRSPFALAVAALIGLLVLALVCIVGASLLGGDGEEDLNATSQAIVSINQTTEAQNAFVTQTLVAIAAAETQEALATDTPTPTPMSVESASLNSASLPTALLRRCALSACGRKRMLGRDRK